MKDKRYTLSLSPELFEKIEQWGEENGLSKAEAFRHCLKSGLIMLEVGSSPDRELFYRESVRGENGTSTVEREVRILVV